MTKDEKETADVVANPIPGDFGDDVGRNQLFMGILGLAMELNGKTLTHRAVQLVSAVCQLEANKAVSLTQQQPKIPRLVLQFNAGNILDSLVIIW